MFITSLIIVAVLDHTIGSLMSAGRNVTCQVIRAKNRQPIRANELFLPIQFVYASTPPRACPSSRRPQSPAPLPIARIPRSWLPRRKIAGIAAGCILCPALTAKCSCPCLPRSCAGLAAECDPAHSPRPPTNAKVPISKYDRLCAPSHLCVCNEDERDRDI